MHQSVSLVLLQAIKDWEDKGMRLYISELLIQIM